MINEKDDVFIVEEKENGKGKLIRTVGDAVECFWEEPIRMIRAARYSAELGISLNKKTYEAILKHRALLDGVAPGEIRQEFEQLLVAEFAGRGLKLLARSGLMIYIIGGLADNMTKRALTQFNILADNIDKTKPVLERRLALFFICFEKKEALKAAKVLNFDVETVELITNALDLLEPLYFIANKLELKKFLVRYGRERYEFLHGLAKAQRVVYDLPDAKILNRHYLMEEIIERGEPVFIKDMKINKNDLTEKNIAEGENADRILAILLDAVHKEANLNTNYSLMKLAEKNAKGGFLLALRRIGAQ
jgi:tRNA nucleotidyltransferase/poly(A) polymerase